ncbi:MAG: right-handed parallel beta-helix repeat-containing protein [Thermoplasmatales archaeon]|nr:right-handed parallel beta-helix repeat-containing protein [Thermoplasmatales archaeon]
MKKYERKTNRIGKMVVLAGVGIVILMVFVSLTSAISSHQNLISSAEITSTPKQGLTEHTPIYIDGNDQVTEANDGASSRSPGTIYVGSGPGNDSTTIQGGINLASVGDTVFVWSGTYYENVVIDKTLTLIGEDRDTTIIDGSWSGEVVYISADWVNMSGFNMRYGEIGVHLYSSSNSTVTDCVACGDPYGISIDSSFGVRISNTFASGMTGIRLSSSSNTYIINCSTSYGNEGITIISSSNNTITNCTICGTLCGMYIKLSSDNNITYCDITNSSIYGLYVTEDSHNNWIHHNNLVNNDQNAYDECSNYWDYNGEGNYWSDYIDMDINNDGVSEGVDNDGDWIGDNPYPISGDSNQDNYPLMYPYPVGNPNKPNDYSSIQDTIDDANTGDTIYVWDGTYYENIIINKTISLVGRDRNTTIIDGSGSGDVVYISADWMNMSGFTIINGGGESGDVGIELSHSNNCSVIYCTVSSNDEVVGIALDESSNNYVTNCVITQNAAGIHLYKSNSNNISNCDITDNKHPLWYFGVSIYQSTHTIVSNCIISSNGEGIWVYESTNNTLADNTINNSQYSIHLSSSSFNRIIRNTISNDFSAAMFLQSADNNIIDKNAISNSYYGISSQYSTGKITNSTIINSVQYDIYLEFGTNDIITLNTTFDKNKVYFYETSSTLTVQWFMHLYVQNNTGDPISGAQVWVNDTYGMNIYTGTTNVNGRLSWIVCTEYIEKLAGHVSDSTPHNVTVSKMGYTTNYAEPLMNETKEVIIVLTTGAMGSVHNLDKDTYYDTIQEAIDDANPGDTIEVSNGTYYENVIINKTITLIGEDRNTTIVDGSGTGDVIYISADWVNVSGFSITHSGTAYFSDAGIDIRSFNNNIINCNIHSNNGKGVYIGQSFNDNVISSNIISNNGEDGIYISSDSCGNKITSNTIHSNNWHGIRICGNDNQIADNNVSSNNMTGIWIVAGGSNNTIIDNDVCLNDNGIGVSYSGNNTIANNRVLSNNYGGIKLDYSSSNNITNCTVYNNSYGIWLYSSSNNNQISNCFVYNNSEGIGLDCSSNNILGDNYVYNNVGGILLLSSSNNNTLRGNCVYNNSKGGINLSNSLNNTLSANHIWNNPNGVAIWYSSNNDIRLCRVYNNLEGIVLDSSSNNNKITYNNITDNINHGIHIYYDIDDPCNSNIFHHNNFVNNGQNAYDPYANFWDNGICEGNYWDNWTSPDDNSDGFVDNPYLISGGDNQDSYPLTHEIMFSDKDAPVISLVSPDNNSVIKPGIVLDFDIADVNLWKATYSVEGSATQLFSSPYDIDTDGWSDGTYNITVYVKDWGMNEISKIFTFIVDCTQPIIDVAGVVNGTYYNISVTPVVDITDLNLNTILITLNDESFISGGTISEEGDYILFVQATDKAGNTVSKTIYFVIDKTNPNITITGVMGGTYYNISVTPVIEFNDTNLNITTITLNGVAFASGTTITGEADYVLVAYVSDKAGNTAQRIVSFTIDKTKPIITISGVTDGAYYNTDVAPVIDISDTNLNTTSITLNGNIFINGTTITAENTYTLFVQAVDKAGNTANKTITFVIDKTTPIITIAESSQTTNKNTFTMSWSASENIQYYEISTNGVNWVNVSMATQHTFMLSKGANALYVRGTDLAENKGTNMITVTYKKEEQKGFIPGFELIYLISALSLVLAFKRRKRI